MPRQFSRVVRLGDQIQRELAELVRREINDYRPLGMVTITAVKVTRDLANAKVYVTVLGDTQTIRGSLRILQRSAGMLRSALASRLCIHTVPLLHFIHDPSVARGIEMSALIDEALAADQRFHQHSEEEEG